MFFANLYLIKRLFCIKININFLGFSTLKNYHLNSSKMHLSQVYAKIGISSLNNDPLDFSKNFNNIMKSIQKCKDLGCKIRVGS